jgi:benzylsuccinate CoA-transferase BbsF subunit
MADLPLKGVRVVDFTWVAMGPMTTRYLADFGATVLRIESETRQDTMRISPPFRDGIPGPNRSGSFAYWNAGKHSISLNMKTSQARHLARRLILEWADVVVDNFTAGIMEGWELGYETISVDKPEIIMLSLSTFGRGNLLSKQPGYGPLLTPLVGITNLTGWPDRDPVCPGPFGAYLDFFLPRVAMFALSSALDYRARTGKGVYLDLAQFEASLQLIAPLVMEAVENDKEAQRSGYNDFSIAPHGVYPCHPEADATLGEEGWIAIVAPTDHHWESLKGVMSYPEWADAAQLSTVLGRLAHREEMDAHIANWTRDFVGSRLMAILQDVGVPAGVVRSNRGLFADKQLQSRGYLPYVHGDEIGKHQVEAPEFHLMRTPHQVIRSAPLLGEHTYSVCSDVLGLTDEEIAILVADGVLS